MSFFLSLVFLCYYVAFLFCWSALFDWFPCKIKEGVTFEVRNIDEGQKLLTPH